MFILRQVLGADGTRCAEFSMRSGPRSSTLGPIQPFVKPMSRLKWALPQILSEQPRPRFVASSAATRKKAGQDLPRLGGERKHSRSLTQTDGGYESGDSCKRVSCIPLRQFLQAFRGSQTFIVLAFQFYCLGFSGLLCFRFCACRTSARGRKVPLAWRSFLASSRRPISRTLQNPLRYQEFLSQCCSLGRAPTAPAKQHHD